ncbi:MAG: hypothetical protein LBI37_02755 [Puniceicoccales bacterium]|jgi:hypothetical protein|nr:hypothetical protein [Puniceicoccales bacterium]
MIYFWGLSRFFVIWAGLVLSCFGNGDTLFTVISSDVDHISDIDCLDTVPLFLQTDNNYELKLERPSHEGDIIVMLEHDIELFPDFD